jgi:hypothetical protein
LLADQLAKLRRGNERDGKNTKGAGKTPFSMVAGPGFEPVPPAASKNLQVLKMNDFKGFRKRKSA